MTKPQIWIASVLVLFFLLFILEKNTQRSDVQKKETPNMVPVPQTGESSRASTPEQLVGSLGCTGCHGSDLSGTKMAPALYNVKQNWSRDELINYLRNPSSYMDSDRFKNFKAMYPNVMMPSFSNIDVKELGKIADYLLKLQR
jgi:mono/diheme cytochrome c family protein